MEKTAVKPPWKSLRDSHFPHSPGDGAFHFTKNTSSAEPAIYPQISLSKQEFRLTLAGWSDFSDPSSRKLQYHFADLQGIIFGMNTSTSDKLRIMKIIEEKCRKEGRSDFEFHQAHYSRRAGKMEIAKMNLIKFA